MSDTHKSQIELLARLITNHAVVDCLRDLEKRVKELESNYVRPREYQGKTEPT